MYEAYDDSGGGRDLRNELEVIDRAIGLLKETKSVNALLTSRSTTRAQARGGVSRGPVSGMVASMAKARGGLGTMLQSLPRPGMSKDESYLIDTTSAQIGTCPHCFEEMPLTQLRKHLYTGSTGASASASACPNMEMRCPEEGCHAMFPARALKRHLNRECAVAKRRRALAEAGLKRKELEREKERQAAIAAVAAAVATAAQPSPLRSPGDGADAWWGRGSVDAEGALQPEAVCELCGESVRQGLLAAHRRDACLHRPVYCPNRPLGCREEVPFARLQEHLYDRCEVERRKDELVERSTRRDVFVCPGCGEELPVSRYRRHQREACANRKAPCKNHYLGCRVMVRPSTRAQHEDVEAEAHARSCLYLGGQGAHLLLQEDDVPSPWTVEFWVMRPDAEASAKAYLRAAVAQAAAFLNAFAVERAVNIAVMKIVIGLKPKTAPKPRRKTPEQEEALREKEERKMAKEARKLARQEKRDKKEGKKKRTRNKGKGGDATDGTETDAAATDASEVDSDGETGPMAATAAFSVEAEAKEEPEEEEPAVKPIADEGRVLAVLTLLVEVYEAAALASLATAQELIGTLKSALNTIDEAITGALADPVAPSFGADGELQAPAPPDPKERNTQWMAKPAASPYASALGVGPVPPDAVTSLVAVPPGERQRAVAAKATRNRRQREREERRQRLREREAVARRAPARGSSPSKSPERAGASTGDGRRERAVAALDSDVDPASSKGANGKRRDDGGSDADVEIDDAAGPRAAATRALTKAAATTSRPATAVGSAPSHVAHKRDVLRTPLALSVTAALCARSERQHVFLMPPQVVPATPAKRGKKDKAKKSGNKGSDKEAEATSTEPEEGDDGAGGRLLRPSEEATARRFLSSLGLLDRYTADIEKRLGLEPPTASTEADDVSVGSAGSAVSMRRRKRADTNFSDGHGTASDADDDRGSGTGGRRRKRTRGDEGAGEAAGIRMELTWAQWREVALGLLKAVDQDCARLQRWRADAGLLDDKEMKRAETATSQAPAGSRPQTQEEMQTDKKKEKEKMRREARKLKRAEEQAARKADKDAARRAKKAARQAARGQEGAGSDAGLADAADGDEKAGSDDDDDDDEKAADGDGDGEQGEGAGATGPRAASTADVRAVGSAGGRGRGRGHSGAGRGGRGSRAATPAPTSAPAPASAPTSAPAPAALPVLRAPAPKPVKFSRRVGDLLQCGVGAEVLAYSAGAGSGGGAAGAWARNLLCLDMQGSAKDRQIDVEALERAGGKKAAKKAAKAAAKAAEEKAAAAAAGAADDASMLSAPGEADTAAAASAADAVKKDKEDRRKKRMALPSVAQEFARVRVPQKPCIGLVVGSGGGTGRSGSSQGGSRPATADTATTAGTTDTAASGTSRASTRGASAGVRSFEYAGASHIPRMKWTHVALVAAKTPKNRVTLYVNGQAVGQAKNYAFPLPMSAIGAPLARSFHGVLLDVRYWAKQRSAVEIQQGMHRLVAMQTDEHGRAVEAQPRVMKRVRPVIDMGRFVSNKDKSRRKRRRDRAARRAAQGLDPDAADDADDEGERGGGPVGAGSGGFAGGDYRVMTAHTVPGALPGTSEGPRPVRDTLTRGSTRGGVRFGDEIAGSPGLVIPGDAAAGPHSPSAAGGGGSGADGPLSPPPSALKGGSRGQKRPLSRVSTTSSVSGGESSDGDRTAGRTGTIASRRRASSRGKGGAGSRPQTAESVVSAVSDASVAAPAPAKGGGGDSRRVGTASTTGGAAGVAAEVDLSSAGLVGWWAFEEGSARVAQKGYVPPPAKRPRGEVEAKRDRVASARAQAAAARAKVVAALQTRAAKAAAEVRGGKKLGFVERSRALHKQVKGGARAAPAAAEAPAVAATATATATTSRPSSAAAPGTAPAGEGEGDGADWALLEERAEAARLAEAAADDLRRNRAADVSERRFPSLVQQRVEGGEHKPPDPFQLRALQEGFWPPEAADTHDVGLGFSEGPPKAPKGAKKPGPLTTAGKRAASDSEGEAGSQGQAARAAKGTVVGPEALQAWRRGGGDGPRWRWLDANYLSALAPVLAAAADGQRDLSPLMADFGATGLLPDVPVPVPSYRNSQQCPFELRRNRLIQLGRALQLEVECPQGCGELVRRVDVRRHTRDECVRRQVPCRFAEVGCAVQHAWQDRAVHEAQYCKFVQARDELVRGAINNSDVVECPLCSERMARAKVKTHTRRACAHRLVRCPYDDCGLSVQAHNLARHFKHDCESAAVLRRIYMIEAARKRTDYARPWGLEIDMAGEGEGADRSRGRRSRRRRGNDEDDEDAGDEGEGDEEDRHPPPVEIGTSGSEGEGEEEEEI